MDSGLVMQLVTSAATTLVGAVATDAWQAARAGFARLLGRGDQAAEASAARRLDELEGDVVAVDLEQRAQVRQQLVSDWRVRLRDLLQDHPELAEPLRELRDEVQVQLPPVQQQWVQNITASAPGATAQGAMFGSVINHAAPATAPPVAGGHGEDGSRSRR